MGQLSALDTAVLALYLGGLFAMGLYFSGKNNTTEEYFLGGRRFKGWVIGLSLVGTSISSITFLAYPGDAYKTAWLRFLPNLMLPVAVIIAVKYFLPFLRTDKTTTAYEFLEFRFGSSIRIYGAVAFITAQIVRISLILYLVSLVLQDITGLDGQAAGEDDQARHVLDSFRDSDDRVPEEPGGESEFRRGPGLVDGDFDAAPERIDVAAEVEQLTAGIQYGDVQLPAFFFGVSITREGHF
ncbi:MAG: hypothetical protein IIA75_03075, partial [Proteobacteria bacterium]|nr:hypothetical protein [Pseudomonadota bacterium]